MAQPSSPAMGHKFARLSQIIQQQNQAQHLLMTKVSQLQGKLAAVQCQQAIQQPQVRDPLFSAVKIKLDLLGKFRGKPAGLSGQLFSMEQYCRIVGIKNSIDMVKLVVSRLELDAFIQWRLLACRSTDYQLGMLGWSDIKAELAHAFIDRDCKLKLYYKLALLKQQTSIAKYTKQFKQIVLELGDQAPDDAALLFIFTESLIADVQMQPLLARPQILTKAEQVSKRADMNLFLSVKHQAQQGQQQHPRQWQPCYPQFQQYQYQRPPPPPPQQGPVLMDLGVVQGQQEHQQKLPQYGASRQIIYYHCKKQGHMVKDCQVRIRGQPAQQQPNFTWIIQPFQYQQPPMYQQPQPQQFQPTFAQMYAQPLKYSQLQFQQPPLNYIHKGAYLQPQVQPYQGSQPLPPPPLNNNRDIY